MKGMIFTDNGQVDPLKKQIESNNLIALMGLNPELYDDSQKEEEPEEDNIEDESVWSKEPVEFLNKVRQYDIDDKKELNDEYNAIGNELKNRNKGGKYGLGEAFDFAVMDYIYNNNFGGLQSYFTNEANQEFTRRAKELEEEKVKKDRKEKAEADKKDAIEEANLELNSLLKKRLNSTNLNERAELNKEIQDKLNTIYGDDEENKTLAQKSIDEQVNASDDRINQIKKFNYELDEVRTDGKFDYKKYNKKFGTKFKNNDEAIVYILHDYIDKFGENGILKDDFAEEQYKNLRAMTGYESDYAKAMKQDNINQVVKDRQDKRKAQKSLEPSKSTQVDDDPY